MRIDPFKEVDELIRYRYRLPIYPRATQIGQGSSFIDATDADFIKLGELLRVLKEHFIKLQKKNTELRDDLREVLSSGAIHWVVNEYYSNYEQVKKTEMIYKKHFRVANESTN